jgi:hypothetical protein
MMFCVLAPVFLASFLKGNKDNIKDEEFINAYAFLVRDFKEKVHCIYFHVIFLIRRLILVASVHLLHNLPLAQVIICSLVCWTVIFMQVSIHILVTRPFKDMIHNVILIFIELSISICYTNAGILLNPDVDQEALMWIILGCMYSSYLLHSILGYYKIIKVIYPKIKDCLSNKRPPESIYNMTFAPNMLDPDTARK